MKVIIAGGRTFYDMEKMNEGMNAYPGEVTEVVCGMARGADSCGKYWVKGKNIPVAKFPAQWDKHGRSAGYKRNVEMAEYADEAVVFWDGQSRGSMHMINIMKEMGKPVTVVRY